MGVIEAWLRVEIMLKASVIHERLVDQHGFTGNYQRTKMHLAEARPLSLPSSRLRMRTR